MTPETRIKRDIITYLDSLAPLCFHFAVHNMGYGKRGIPDRIACYRGYFIGIEIKAEKGQPTPYQLDRNREIEATKGVAIVARTVEDVQAAIRLIDARCEEANHTVWLAQATR